jgi:uncharacterized membrane protein YecN with MAPEG domain
MLAVTAFFAAILTFALIALSVVVIRRRQAASVALGDGNHKLLSYAIRAQGNFTEYAPLFLVLMALSEIRVTTMWLLVLAGGVFCIGRLLHAFSLHLKEPHNPSDIEFRVMGMVMTFTALGALAVALLVSL